ncbi:MAG: hypothetical protein ACKVUS_12070 [Saprospiraceae bacterium]
MLTNILVRPAARGGKYLGPDAANADNHSASVSILNLKTGQRVAEAYVNTLGKDPGPANIMAPVSRAAPFPTDPNTVGVTLKVDITEPTDFRVSVFGPLSFPDQARLAQADITVLPGVDIGVNVYSPNALMPTFPEGLVIEVPGLCISNVAANWTGAQVSCSAKVTMMCGCPINDIANWPWPPTDFTIQLVTYMQSGAVYKYTLGFDTNPNLVSSFIGQWPNQAGSGDSAVQAWIFASEPKLGNQGKYKIPTP